MRWLMLLILLVVPLSAESASIPERAVAVGRSLVGTVEATGHNDGPVIERILGFVGLPAGNPYCAATVVYCYGQAAKPAANPLPKIARVSLLWQRCQLSPRYRCFSRAQILAGVYRVAAGDVFVMLFGTGSNPNGHTGMLTDARPKARAGSIEGNTMPTDAGNQREGGGIYARERSLTSLVGIIRVKT